jgi:soluble lytic murein transglycosylase
MRYLLLCLAVAFAPLSARADQQAEALGLALAALARGDVALAAQAAAPLTDPVARDIVEWTRLRRGEADWADHIAFLDRNPDWPGLDYLRAQGEPSIPENADPARVRAYFATIPPATGAGALALALAHLASGDQSAAEAEAIRAWTTITMTGEEAAAL